MTPHLDTPRSLLNAAYEQLDFSGGDLLAAGDDPKNYAAADWINKGDWLALAKKVRAEKVFFVDGNPVIIFAAQDATDQNGWQEAFNHVWCMARPQLLFLARAGELTVYNLTKEPARVVDEDTRSERVLGMVQSAAMVQSVLHRYRRDQVESGRLFEDKAFGFHDRADCALVRDLKKVRADLRTMGLSVEHAHALIGRSIFIRYLEDREVLKEEHFRAVAGQNPSWMALLDAALPDRLVSADERLIYAKVLSSKEFTYALFRWLAEHFNGDMFPLDGEEEESVTQDHLNRLRSLLLGSDDSSLFFFAYRFDIIPIELISSIYEEFYGVEQDEQEGEKVSDHKSYYTPSPLVEFVLAQTLKPEVLAGKPRVMDPACGSGIFLVEAFRRFVRHRVSEVRRRLTPDELRKILRDQILGIDINPEAVRVAAFSLYLALLHYQKPPDILYKRLPSLTYATRSLRDPKTHYDILLASDAFHVEEKVPEAPIRKRFSAGCADVVVGNPPWGDMKGSNEYLASGKRGAIAWCEDHDKSVGDKEYSQAFIHRTLDLLRDGGRAGLLVSTGVFFKRYSTSRRFREQWLTAASLLDVRNFAAVREAFFSGPGHKKKSIAPFASVVFEKRVPEPNHRFAYWSAKKVGFIEHTQAVVLSRADLHVVPQQAFLSDDDLWKVYWWGGHRDEALLQTFRCETTLAKVVDPTGQNSERFARGFQTTGSPQIESDWLNQYAVLPTRSFFRYGPLPPATSIAFGTVPDRVFRRGVRQVYEGMRLLIKRGVTEKGGANGRIIARLESGPFCFRDSIHGVSLQGEAEAEGKLLLGILWSSLARYYLFMTSGTWGMWHHEIKRETIERIPVRIPKSRKLRNRIVKIVDELREGQPADKALFDDMATSRSQPQLRVELEAQLDQAVFALYELADEEQDLVLDMCNVGLDLFYNGMKSKAAQPVPPFPGKRPYGRREDIPRLDRSNDLVGYLECFLAIWEPEVKRTGGGFRWRVVRPGGESPMLAVLFSVESPDEPLPDPTDSDEQAWRGALGLLAQTSAQPELSRIYIDGMVRIVTKEDIVIIKRNERRLWTRTAARYDAEAALNQILRRQIPGPFTR